MLRRLPNRTRNLSGPQEGGGGATAARSSGTGAGQIPRGGTKTPIAHLTEIPRLPWEGPERLSDTTAIYRFEDAEGTRQDLLWAPKEGATRLFVLFSGDAMRSKYDPPVFQRWKWASALPGDVLYISDPTLWIDDTLGLAWYSGTAEHDPLAGIVALIRAIAAARGVPESAIVTYGSSGGGFAALRVAAALPEAIAVPINPQTTITDYEFRNVEKYLRTAFGTADRALALERHPRLSLAAVKEALAGRRIVYIQNLLDPHHVESHLAPFARLMGVDPETENRDTGSFRLLFFEREGGHGAAETQEVFDAALEIVTGWTG